MTDPRLLHRDAERALSALVDMQRTGNAEEREQATVFLRSLLGAAWEAGAAAQREATVRDLDLEAAANRTQAARSRAVRGFGDLARADEAAASAHEHARGIVEAVRAEQPEDMSACVPVMVTARKRAA